MNVQLAILLCGAMGSSQIAIPINYWHLGQPYISTTIPRITGDRIIEMGLTAYSSSATFIVSDDFIDESGWAENITVHVGRARSFYPQYLFVSAPEDRLDDNRGDFARLGIGRGSPLVRDYGSVDFIQSSVGPGSMVVNSTLDWFKTCACIENSVISAPYILTPYADVVRILVGVGSSKSTSVDYVLTPSPLLMSLPAELFHLLTTIIRGERSTLSIKRGRITFGRCSLIRHRLPNLRIVVNDHEISLTPGDYTRDSEESDQCDLLVRPLASKREHAINPFLLPYKNVRFTNTTLFICDSNVTEATRLE